MKGFSLNRRRVVSSFLMLLMSLMLFASYAMGADDLAAIANRGNDNTIDSVLENSEVVATSEAATTNENTSNSVSSSTNRAEGTQELMKAFSNTNMLEKNNLDNEFTQSASNIVSKAVQHLIFLISLGVIVLIVFDVAFPEWAWAEWEAWAAMAQEWAWAAMAPEWEWEWVPVWVWVVPKE